jgi:hypothetical protein
VGGPRRKTGSLGVEIVGPEDEVAADRPAVPQEWTLTGRRLAVLHAHRGRVRIVGRRHQRLGFADRLQPP